MLQRRPEYSVWNPATSSLSASARSKGAAIHASRGAGEIDPKHDEREWIVEQIPVREPAALHLADGAEVHGAGQHHRHEHAQAQRRLIAYYLGSFAHRAKERPLRPRSVAGQNHAEYFQPQHGDHEERGHIEPQRGPAIGKWQSEVAADRCAKTHIYRHAKQQRIGGGRHQVFLGDELHAIGQGLQPAELAAHASRPEPILNAAGHFAARAK